AAEGCRAAALCGGCEPRAASLGGRQPRAGAGLAEGPAARAGPGGPARVRMALPLAALPGSEPDDLSWGADVRDFRGVLAGRQDPGCGLFRRDGHAVECRDTREVSHRHGADGGLDLRRVLAG